MDFVLSNARALAHEAVARVVRRGDGVADATLGNGHDALFLCGLIGESGVLYGFDIQNRAVERSRARLAEAAVTCAVHLYTEGHECLSARVPVGVAAVMFNLGWLPGGDKSVTTRADTTVSAVSQAVGLIRSGGIVTVCAYPGHAEGTREREAVAAYLSALDARAFAVLRHTFINQPNDPPEFFLVQRIARD